MNGDNQAAVPRSREEIAERIVRMARVELDGDRLTGVLQGGRRLVTTHIKRSFGALGLELGYRIAATGFPDAHFGEWLYDMAWFVLGDADRLIRQSVVIEFEFMPGGSVKASSEVDGDFQKLVQARADARVWAAFISNAEMRATHVANCKDQVRLFAGTSPDDLYVLILYNWATQITSVEQFTTSGLAVG